jgi:AraC-like DNA-binding protein
MEAHLRLTAEEVKNLYRQKLINARGLVYLFLTASRKKGWKLRGYVAQLAQELGISERQFYRAVKDLSALNLIDFTIHGEISIWATDNSVADLESLRISDDSAKPVRDFDNLVSDFDKVVSDSDNLVSKKGLEPSEEADSSTPSYIYNSLQSLSPSPPATLRERGEEEEDSYFEDKELKGEEGRVTDEKKNASEGKSSAAAKNCEKKEISDLELLEFIERQNPSVRSPKAYARACLKNDRDYWLQEYRSWQLRKQEADRQWEAYQEYKPDPPVKVDSEQARANIRRIREMLKKI